MKLRLTRSLDDIPMQATDDELLAWSATLCADESPAAAPESPAPHVVKRRNVEIKDITHLTDDELFADIFERAAAVGGGRAG